MQAQSRVGQVESLSSKPETGKSPKRLYASKMIMRPGRETKEYCDPCPGQRDGQYDAGSLREPGLTPENAVPHRRAAAQPCGGADDASRPVARPARAMPCGERQDRR